MWETCLAPGWLNPFPKPCLPPWRSSHPGETVPFPSSDARPLPDALLQCPGPGLSTPPLRAPFTSVSSWPSSGRAGLMNVGLWLQARPRPALQSPAQGFCWPLCPSATRAQGRGVFGSGLNLLVHVCAFPPRLRSFHCGCNVSQAASVPLLLCSPSCHLAQASPSLQLISPFPEMCPCPSPTPGIHSDSRPSSH